MTILSNVKLSPSTSLGGLIGVVVGGICSQVLPMVVQYMGAQPSTLWQAGGLALGLVIPLLMKDVQNWQANAQPLTPAATPPSSPGATSVKSAILVLALSLALPALAQAPATTAPTTPPPVAAVTTPLSFQLTPDLTALAQISALVVEVDITHSRVIGKVPLTGLYVLESKKLGGTGLAAGGAVNFGPGGISGAGEVGVASPPIPFGGQTFRLLGIFGRQWGPGAFNFVGFTPSFQF
jgi:hypothetical protein